MTSKGEKFDQGKPRWDLLPWDQVEDIVKVLTMGAKKYSDDNWQEVPDAKRRYFAAALRHLTAWKRGELTDPESGLPHLAHAACSLLFLGWFDANVAEKITAEYCMSPESLKRMFPNKHFGLITGLTKESAIEQLHQANEYEEYKVEKACDWLHRKLDKEESAEITAQAPKGMPANAEDVLNVIREQVSSANEQADTLENVVERKGLSE